MDEHKEVCHNLFYVYPFPLDNEKQGYAASCLNLICDNFESFEDALIWVASTLANQLEKQETYE